jgi:hypothetical protein
VTRILTVLLAALAATGGAAAQATLAPRPEYAPVAAMLSGSSHTSGRPRVST